MVQMLTDCLTGGWCRCASRSWLSWTLWSAMTTTTPSITTST